ncbi:precorrin-6y C5,15-methyltransferase (decarboxylating) subunit CbiE [Actinokineospora spheciospongiae]|uniref:precorrin-6y C5,15-methyltransferase (decarboxylating) subunit CbiE n=1 Tax=Actinokineospora spheciospongiae TaxID=909613 RepID=UPI001F2906B0|nr:precorrin-6y C5,15-methyltransferase (decarboxylating) subunit CbiE [Actinokineospora spheciospongiae]
MVTVVGIGADGWTGLAPASRSALARAEVVLGAPRQLDLLPPEVTAERVAWPTPLLPAVPALLAAHAGSVLCVLASGDPMFHGIGTTLARHTAVRVLPHPSSASLACARLGWALDGVAVVSAVARPVERLHAALHPGARVLVLSEGSRTPAAVAALLRDRGFGPSRMTVLSDLGADTEAVVTATAAGWSGEVGPLNVVAVECAADPRARRLPRVPGLPDDVFEHDGQITKREVRALTVSSLAPEPGELLWDVGAGSGSVGIEWSRADPACRAVAVEPRADRAGRIGRNALALGVPELRVVTGSAPGALAGLPEPDAVFVGGGVTADGVLPACWAALRPGGRLVVNAVTLESEVLVARWHGEVGGTLTRVSVGRAGPVGGFTGWRQAMPVTQWVAVKESE